MKVRRSVLILPKADDRGLRGTIERYGPCTCRSTGVGPLFVGDSIENEGARLFDELWELVKVDLSGPRDLAALGWCHLLEFRGGPDLAFHVVTLPEPSDIELGESVTVNNFEHSAR